MATQKNNQKGNNINNQISTSVNLCRKTRSNLWRIIKNKMSIDSDWIQNHIAVCPKCQRRVLSLGKVDIALSVLKSQPHSLNLLQKANTQAISSLKHSLQQSEKADKLKLAVPKPGIVEQVAPYKGTIGNIAACIAICTLLRIGISSNVPKAQTCGQNIIKNYYAANCGQDLADECFTS